mgnify:CR=1 FL=1
MTGRSLANAYAKTLGAVFTESPKPYEVELVVAEAGADQGGDQLYRIGFDGSVADERGYVAMGGEAEPIATALRERWSDGLALGPATRLARDVLSGEREEPLAAASLEVAALERARPRRAFRRITGGDLESLLSG